MSNEASVALKEKPVVIGRDELNLAEFALGLASDRNTKQVKTVERRQTLMLANGGRLEQVWTVTGSDKYGLPRAGDDDVLLALLKLASDNGLNDRVVYFTRYEVMQILEWTPNGRNYQRFQSALDRLAGVRVVAKNSFWDNSRKSYVNLNFGLIDDYVIADRPSPHGQLDMPLTHVSFNEKFFHSLQVGSMKRLDLQLYNSLGSSLSKRLYRYLDKRRYKASVIDLEITQLATVNLGLDLSTRKYPSQIKQLLDTAHQELHSRGFLAGWSYRYSEDRACWYVQYSFPKASQSADKAGGRERPVQERPEHSALLQRGFGSRMAATLVQQYGDRISAKLDLFDHLVKSKSPLIARNPLGWLRKAIEDDYQQVPGYQPPEVRRARQARVESEKQAQNVQAQLEQDQRDRLWSRFLALPVAERETLLKQAKRELRFLSAEKLNGISEDSPLLRGTLLELMQSREEVA